MSLMELSIVGDEAGVYIVADEQIKMVTMR